MKGKPFGPGNRGNTNGRPPGIKNWWTETRNQLRQALPEAMAALLDAVKGGDVAALRLYFSIVTPPIKAGFPPVPIDLNQPPSQILDGVKRLMAEGAISSDHADSILSLLAKSKRLETSILMEAKEVQGSVLEAFQVAAATAASLGDLDTLESAGKSALPYLQAKPQPELPPQTATASAVPYSPEELAAMNGDYSGWEKQYANGASEDP